jgi:hypothetical protein
LVGTTEQTAVWAVKFIRVWLDASAPRRRMVDSLIETENCGKFQPELGLVCGIPYQHEVVLLLPVLICLTPRIFRGGQSQSD